MSRAAEIFRQAAQLIEDDPARHGNCVRVGSPGRVVVAGDIHGHRGNLQRILAYAKPSHCEPPMLILQELIHGPIDSEGRDRSAEVMLQAAQAKMDRPEKVLYLMGNHAMSQITGSEITKHGHGVCKAFVEGIRHKFGSEAPDVFPAVMRFCRSLPLAIRFDNGVHVSHSLPSPNRMIYADPGILDRPYEDEDFRRGGPAYEWTWGRNQTPEQLEGLAEALDVEFFLLGHRHVKAGSMVIPGRALAINSDGPGGAIFEFHSDETITLDNAPSHIKPVSKL